MNVQVSVQKRRRPPCKFRCTHKPVSCTLSRMSSSIGAVSNERRSRTPTYELPAIGKPPDRPRLEKIAVEEHFNFLDRGRCRYIESGSPERRAGDGLRRRLVGSGRRASRGLWCRRLWRAWTPAGSASPSCRTPFPACRASPTPPTAVAAARDVNDFLAAEVAKQPGRYAGFASVAVAGSRAAASELDRAVNAARAQRRDGQRLHQHDDRAAGRVSRRAEVPAVLGSGGGAERAGLPASAAGTRPTDLPGAQRVDWRDVGLCAGDRDARAAPDLQRTVRPVSRR